MIEIISVRELRYSSPEDVPIKKQEVIRDSKYYTEIQITYDKIRKMLLEKVKEKYEIIHIKDAWSQVSNQYDREFFNRLIYVWKRNVFDKTKTISKEIVLQKEKEIIEECFKDGSVQLEVEEYFASEFWKGIHLSKICEEKN